MGLTWEMSRARLALLMKQWMVGSFMAMILNMVDTKIHA